MFRRLLRNFRAMTDTQPVIPPDQEDPLAGQISWSPVKTGGSNFCSHRLKQARDGHYGFQPTPAAVAWHAMFLALAIGFVVAPFLLGAWSRKPAVEVSFTFIGIGLVVLIGVVFSLRELYRLVHIDIEAGWIWLFKPAPDKLRYEQIQADTDHYVRIEDVHALQVVAERCRPGRENEFFSYELNIVRHDGTRVNLVDHGRGDLIDADAKDLAELLSVPVWSARQ